MNEKGFIASSLLYGMLALFLVIMLSTLALLGSRKLSMDQLKKNALITVETGYSNPENIVAIYDTFQKPDNDSWLDLSGNRNNAKLVNGVTFNDGIKFNNINSHVDTALTSLSGSFAIVTTLNINNGVIWSYGDLYAEVDNNILKICVDEDCEEGTHISGKRQLTFIFNNNSFQIYNNSELVEESSVIDNISDEGQELIIGNNKSFEKQFTGSIYNFVVYKGIDDGIFLTDKSIVNNYQIDVEKYGLTS